jgi:hypothetical protein
MNILSKPSYLFSVLLVLSITCMQCNSDAKSSQNAYNNKADAPVKQLKENKEKDNSEGFEKEIIEVPQKTVETNPSNTEASKIIAEPQKKVVKETQAAKKKPATKKTKPAPPKTALLKPDIKFDKQIYDWDTITEGDKFDFDFIFTNTGKTNLEIYSASATCGCTQPSFPFIEIPPGEKSKIGVKYNSVGKEGNEKATISIKTNVREAPFTLFLEGYIKPKSKAKPDQEKEKLIKIISVPDSLKEN